MRIFRQISFFVLIFLAASCGSGDGKRSNFRLGIDPNWYPLDFGALQPYVNGFTEDLLLEISQYAGVDFVKIESNWDSLLEGLQSQKYDAVLTSFPDYHFNKAKYEFSQNFLDLGPVLVVPSNAKFHDLSKLSNEVVGVVVGDSSLLILQKYPEIIVRKYETTPALLEALATGSLEGALLDRLDALTFIKDMYKQQLKISTAPLTTFGLHMVSLKGQQERLMQTFERALKELKKQKKLQALQDKWQI